MAAMVEIAKDDVARVSVYEVPESDWQTWRELRLEALTDAPYAFGETLARARSLTEAEWRSWWDGREFAGPRFIGVADGAPAGMCSLCFPEDHDHEPLIINMWTSPRVRGRGLGRAMLDACVTYCVQAGHPRLLLGVVEDNLPARRLYESYGFVYTGGREPLRSNPSTSLLWMTMQLNGNRAQGLV